MQDLNGVWMHTAIVIPGLEVEHPSGLNSAVNDICEVY